MDYDLTVGPLKVIVNTIPIKENEGKIGTAGGMKQTSSNTDFEHILIKASFEEHITDSATAAVSM